MMVEARAPVLVDGSLPTEDVQALQVLSSCVTTTTTLRFLLGPRSLRDLIQEMEPHQQISEGG